MRVMFYCYAVDGVQGGIEKLVAELSNFLVSVGNDVCIVADSYPEAPFPFSLDERINLVRMRLHVGHQTAARLRSSIERFSPDIIVAMRNGSWVHMMFSVATGNTNVPIVLSEHNCPRIAIDDFPNKHRYFAMERSAAIHMLLDDYVSSVDERHRNKVTVIPNFTDLKDYETLAGRRRDKTSNFQIVMVGRLTSKQKRPILLYHAFKHLAQSFSDWTLVYCGEGPELQTLRSEVAADGLSDRVFFKGAVKAIDEELSNSDIFCLPSAYEGFSIALVEAMMSGLPSVVFSDSDGNNAMISDRETGMLAEAPGTAATLAAALQDLMQSAQLRFQIGMKAGQWAQRFEKKKILSQWSEFLTETCSKSSGTSKGLSEAYTETLKYYVDNDLFGAKRRQPPIKSQDKSANS